LTINDSFGTKSAFQDLIINDGYGHIAAIMAEKKLTCLVVDCDWNGRREEMQHWACWRKSGRFRVFQDWAASRISFFILMEFIF
jgi:hypothetical protein